MTPEYVVSYHKTIYEFLESRIASEERTKLEADLAIQFTIGMWDEQKTHSIEWMKQAVSTSKLSEGQAAELLGVNRATVNRWVNGKVDPPFSQVQRFYACFGANDERDHPFRQRDTLNLGGYIQAVIFLKQWLQEKGLEKKPYNPSYIMTTEILACLYYYYANIETMDFATKSTQREFTDFIQETLNAVQKVVPKEQCVIQAPSDFQMFMAYWGLAWLICLTLIAEDENGVEPFRVSTKRPVRLH